MIMKNPEFVRNLWLRISPVRLIAAVGVLAVVVAVVLVSVSAPNDPWEFLINLADTALLVALLIWGGATASATVRDELRGNTWNQQRMSGLSPWQLTWGKLFGGTAYVWWIAFWLILLWGIASFAVNKSAGLVMHIATWIAAAIGVHALAMIAALGFRSADGSRVQETSTVAWALPLIVLSQVFGSLLRDSETSILWYGRDFSPASIGLLLALPFMLWAVIGAYRSIREEMQEAMMPWALPACLFTFGFLLGGFGAEGASGSLVLRGLVFSLLLTTLLTWLTYLAEPHSFSSLRDGLSEIRAGRTRVAMQQISSSTTLLLFLLVLAALCVVLTVTMQATPYQGGRDSLVGAIAEAAPWIYLWLMIVAIRDFLVAHVLQRIGKTSRRAMGAFVVYLGIMYVAVPLALGGVLGQHAVKWWLPMSSENEVSGAAGLVGPLLTLGVVIALCIRFFGRRDDVQTPTEH